MASFERTLVSMVLSTLRARREKLPALPNEIATGAVVPLERAKIREARFSDFRSVNELKQRWKMAADSPENWQRLWKDNPALREMGIERPIGWVLEANGSVVGYLGNISKLYRYGDKILTSVTSHALVVDVPYRAIGVSLVAAYYRQKAVDLYISTGAIAPVGKIAQAFKSEFLLRGDKEKVLFWILRSPAFSRAVMRKLSVNPALSSLGSFLMSATIDANSVLGHRQPKKSGHALSTTEISIAEIGDSFENFWNEKVKERPALLADRSPEALRWQFEIPGDRGRVRIICCNQDGKFVGYAAVRNECADESGLRKTVIVELLAKNDDSAIVHTLFRAAYQNAQEAESDMLEVMGFPEEIIRALEECKPYVRTYPTRLFGYKAVDPRLHKTLSDGETWRATPFDGDLTLIRASYPQLNPLEAEAIDYPVTVGKTPRGNASHVE